MPTYDPILERSGEEELDPIHPAHKRSNRIYILIFTILCAAALVIATIAANRKVQERELKEQHDQEEYAKALEAYENGCSLFNDGKYEEAFLQFEKSDLIPRSFDYRILIHGIRYYNEGDYHTAHSNFAWVGTDFLESTAAAEIQAMDDRCCEIINALYEEKQKELAEESKSKTSTKKATTQHTIPYDFYDVYYYDDPYEFYYDHVNDFYDLEDAEDYFYEHVE